MAQTMLLKGSIPSGLFVDDLVFDPATGFVGLRDGSTVTWIDPDIPFSTKGTTGAPTSTTMSLTTAADGTVYGVDSGLLFEVSLGSPATSLALTTVARPNFVAESIATSGGAVFALGEDTTTGESVLVRFDVATGDFTDEGVVGDEARALFVR